MREEEKLARDVYVALGDRWGLRVFENIARAEQRHMDAVVAQLDREGVDYEPVVLTGTDFDEILDGAQRSGRRRGDRRGRGGRI